MLLAGPVRVRPGIATGRGISKSQARDCNGAGHLKEPGPGLQWGGASQRARPGIAMGRLEESTRSATTRANEPGPDCFATSQARDFFVGGSRMLRLEPPTKKSRAVACRHIPPHIPPLPAVQARGRRWDVRRCLARYQYTFQLLGMKSFS